jgi:hypothetical protein
MENNSIARSLEIIVKVAVKNKVVQMDIKLSSCKTLCQYQTKKVKNFIIDAKGLIITI